MAASRGVPKITRVRKADDNHRVVRIETKGAEAVSYRREPCGGCPWRKDQTGQFPAEAFRISANTAYDAAQETFGCHESGQKKPATCAGFLLQNAANNLSVRLSIAFGKADFSGITDGGHDLHESYRAMAEANGVDHNDPVLAPCRANDGSYT